MARNEREYYFFSERRAISFAGARGLSFYLFVRDCLCFKIYTLHIMSGRMYFLSAFFLSSFLYSLLQLVNTLVAKSLPIRSIVQCSLNGVTKQSIVSYVQTVFSIMPSITHAYGSDEVLFSSILDLNLNLNTNSLSGKVSLIPELFFLLS